MSGAPIIQNNKLIGSLTYVFKHNSKKGYGIFIDEMLKL
ncbi:MAG: SpoIVB peptidase S55 domain-containing protein [Terrisporobacter sp.]